MKGKYILAFAGMMITAAMLAIPAGAAHTISGQKVYRNFECKKRVNPYDPSTWACTTITVNPWQADAGGTTTVIYSFKAKKKLRYVYICFSKINSAACAYRHKLRTMKKGKVVKRLLQLPVPAVTESGDYKFDNYTRFYKLMKHEDRGSDWVANAYMCVISPSQPDYQCTGG